MKFRIFILGIAMAAFLVIGMGIGYWIGQRQAGAVNAEATDHEAAVSSPAATEPIAAVDTVTLVPSTIEETYDAYGVVVGDPANQQTVTAPFEGRVVRVLASAGQEVKADQDLAEIAPSADVQLAVVQARSAVETATRDLSNTQERFDLKLATTQELQASQSALRDAQVKLDNLAQRGATGNHMLQAHRAGIVSKIDASVGQVLAAGSAVVEIDDAKPAEVRLGVEAAEAQRLTIGAAVELMQVGEGKGSALGGTIRLIPPRVNAESRLVEVFVSLPEDSRWLMGSFVEGHVILGSAKDALVVPRSAVLPTDDGLKLYTVEEGKATAHAVTTGLQTDQQYEIIEAKPALKAGDLIVQTGNYELDDGMAVTTRPAP